MADVEKLEAALRDRESEARVKRMWDRIDTARRRPLPTAARSGVRIALGAGALAVAAALVLWLRPAPAPAALTLVGGGALHGALPPGATTELSDASRIEAEADARLDVLESSPRSVSLGLRGGRARFVVTPGGPRAWHVECGGVTVDVVGTIFTVDRDGEHVTVSVERGSVLVRGDEVPDHAQRLEAGGRLEIGAPERPATVASAPAPAPAAEPDLAPAPEPAPAAAAEPERETSADPAGDLLASADEARRNGNDARAVRLLDAVVSRHGDDPRAALAAYTLGRLRLDRTGDARGAARSFARAISLGLPEELAESARAGRAVALLRAHDAGAERAVDEYLEAYPDGRSRAEVLRAVEMETP